MKRMLAMVCVLLAGGALLAGLDRASARRAEKKSAAVAQERVGYLGLDRNLYPGDENLAALARQFAYTSYWLNIPPGEKANGWVGKREAVKKTGMGFLLLYNGRTYAQIVKAGPKPGARDGAEAVEAARQEGFAAGAVVFLDVEEGGRMLAEQKQYIFSWAEAVKAGGYRPGVYCSGIEFEEGDGQRISTARDLYSSAAGRELVYWVANDACPPAPGCVIPKTAPSPALSGVGYAEVWQYAQSPIREYAKACRASYNADGDCMVEASGGEKLHVDLNVARQADPSGGRR